MIVNITKTDLGIQMHHYIGRNVTLSEFVNRYKYFRSFEDASPQLYNSLKQWCIIIY